MELTQITLGLTTFLCSLVTGLVWTFALIVMPGLRKLDDHDFLRGFQVMDRIIQDRHPLFIVVWLGSILSILASVILSVRELTGSDLLLVLLAGTLFLFGVQLPTFAINIPLNNKLQNTDLDVMTATALADLRGEFATRWVRWNAIRTVAAAITTALLLLVLLRL